MQMRGIRSLLVRSSMWPALSQTAHLSPPHSLWCAQSTSNLPKQPLKEPCLPFNSFSPVSNGLLLFRCFSSNFFQPPAASETGETGKLHAASDAPSQICSVGKGSFAAQVTCKPQVQMAKGSDVGNSEALDVVDNKQDCSLVVDKQSHADSPIIDESIVQPFQRNFKSGVIKSLANRKRGFFNPQGRLPDLLSVPGIGPRNMEKLVAKGIGRVAELKQLYVDKFRNSNEKMVEYLQSAVGILHKHHAVSIASYIRDAVEKELSTEESMASENAVNQKKRLTFCIEGNISVGKTTFLEKVTNEAVELRDLVEIVPEPVAKWQDVGPEHFNVLDAFYAEPARYAYTFQNYVFITRLMQEQESRGGLKPLRLMERSVFSDRMVFVRAVHEAKWMNEMEISIYDSWFNPVVSVLPGLIPDGFIYLRASPDTCLQRLQMRKRPEEQSVTIDYLRDLHEKHEQWLFPTRNTSGGILSVTSPSQLIECLPPSIKGRVFYLEGDHIHSSIQKIPALILDCDANIDFNRDFEAKARYARQVGEFFQYVQQAKAFEGKAQPPGHNPTSRSLLVPRSNGLFMPPSPLLHPQVLKPIGLGH